MAMHLIMKYKAYNTPSDYSIFYAFGESRIQQIRPLAPLSPLWITKDKGVTESVIAAQPKLDVFTRSAVKHPLYYRCGC